MGSRKFVGEIALRFAIGDLLRHERREGRLLRFISPRKIFQTLPQTGWESATGPHGYAVLIFVDRRSLTQANSLPTSFSTNAKEPQDPIRLFRRFLVGVESQCCRYGNKVLAHA
jgi:hypothetical protein